MPELTAFYLAASAVTLFRYLRLKERRLLPLMLAFALTGVGLARGALDPWGRGCLYGAGLCGLALLLLLTSRHHTPA